MHTVNTQKTQQNSVYMPYGFAPTAASALITYTGERYDVSSKGYLLGNGYRLYLPSLMRFTSPDSIAPFETLNNYSYCGADPVNHIDPSGHLHINPHVASRIWNKTRYVERSIALDNKKAAALKTLNKLQHTKEQIKNYQSPRDMLKAEIYSAIDNIDTAVSYGNWREYSRYEKEIKYLRSRLKKLPTGPSRKLHALREREVKLQSKFISRMESAGLPADDTGVEQLEPITPMNIRQYMPSQRVWVSKDGNFMIRRSYRDESLP